MQIKKKMIYASLVAILIICFFIFISYKLLYKSDSQGIITFIEEEQRVEYGTEVDSKTFIKEVQGEVIKYPVVDTSKLGEQELIYDVVKDGKSEQIKYSIKIVDTTAPTIVFSMDVIEVFLNSEFKAQDYIMEVKDVVDGDIPFEDRESKNKHYTIQNDVNTSSIGTYQVQVVAVDASGNKVEKTLEVKVVETISSNEVVPTYINGILIVNKKYGLPKEFGGSDSTANNALFQLQAQAAIEGYDMPVVSSYRSYDYQVNLYNTYVARDGEAEADRYSAKPGHSEHQTGLCFDVGAIDNAYGTTAAGKWLATHAQEYGFIIRFPEGKEDITGYMYEPWHIRYVGLEHAKNIYKQNITLEEYLGVNE